MLLCPALDIPKIAGIRFWRIILDRQQIVAHTHFEASKSVSKFLIRKFNMKHGVYHLESHFVLLT